MSSPQVSAQFWHRGRGNTTYTRWQEAGHYMTRRSNQSMKFVTAQEKYGIAPGVALSHRSISINRFDLHKSPQPSHCIKMKLYVLDEINLALFLDHDKSTKCLGQDFFQPTVGSSRIQGYMRLLRVLLYPRARSTQAHSQCSPRAV